MFEADELIRRWTVLLPDSPALGRALVTAYCEPARRYHDARHLLTVLDGIQVLADEAADLVAVRLAAWFHDAVYDVRAVDNEERSAGWAESALPGAGVGDAVVRSVARLVRLTATHAPQPDDADGLVLCDADLVILASPPAAYAAYTRAVREEYAHVGDADFRAGRAAVLEPLVALPALYGTSYGRREWEAAARANLTRELSELRGGSSR